MDVANELIQISRKLSRAVNRLEFGEPVTNVYNPLAYARQPHEAFIERFAQGPKEAVFLGMNPGPFGMAQTGVPFGEVALVRDWMGIEAPVSKPKEEHPKRPITGFECTRSEVSGARLWGWARDRFKTPQRFFQRFYVLNYCPLIFLEETGRNRTPDKLPIDERKALEAVCDKFLCQMIEVLEPKMIIGVGAFATKKAKLALAEFEIPIGTVLHPSPASPIANRGWAPQAERDLAKLGIKLPSS